MIQLDLQSRLPIYEQLKHRIAELVLLKELGPDEALPSVRSLARDLGINPNTVQKAYQELERDGIVYSVAGRGSYINPSADLSAQLMESHIKKIKTVVRHAKACGIPEERVAASIAEVYREDEAND